MDIFSEVNWMITSGKKTDKAITSLKFFSLCYYLQPFVTKFLRRTDVHVH